MRIIRRKEPADVLQKAIGYRFKNRALLEAALMHRSFRFDSKNAVAVDNERLEFLGDSVIGMLACAYLYERFPADDEGRLTALKSRAICGRTLYECALSLDLGAHLRMGSGEELSGGRGRVSTLADAMEAIIGAAFLDGGLKAAERIFQKVMMPRMADLDVGLHLANPKGVLQERSQALWKKSPVYRLLSREGPAHESLFTVEVEMADGSKALGRGRNKQAAEQDAATAMLAALSQQGPN